MSWIDFSNYVIQLNDRTKIAWKRYPDEVLFGEIKILLARFGIKPSVNVVNSTVKVVKMYVENQNMFYTTDNHNFYSDASIGKMLNERVKGRTNPDNEARKTLKIWLNSSQDDFLNSLETLIRFNKKSNKIIPLNELLYFCAYYENNVEKRIEQVSYGFFNSNVK